MLAAVTLSSALTGCMLPTAPAPVSSNLLVDYYRSGGFTNFDDHLTVEIDGAVRLTRHKQSYVDVLTPEQLQQLQHALVDVDFSALKRAYRPDQQGADLIEYRISYAGYTVRVMDTAIPDSLQSLLDLLNDTIEQIQ